MFGKLFNFMSPKKPVAPEPQKEVKDNNRIMNIYISDDESAWKIEVMRPPYVDKCDLYLAFAIERILEVKLIEATGLRQDFLDKEMDAFEEAGMRRFHFSSTIPNWKGVRTYKLVCTDLGALHSPVMSKGGSSPAVHEAFLSFTKDMQKITTDLRVFSLPDYKHPSYNNAIFTMDFSETFVKL